MRAMAIREFGGRDRIEALDVDPPPVGPDSVLVRVRAAGVNPVDAMIREGALAGYFPTFFPLVLGWDAAGVVEQVGPAVGDFRPGQEVYGYCRKDYVRDGTYGELVSVRPFHLALKPSSASFEEAGGVPLAGLTAFQMVHDALAVERDQTVLVHGGSGGVGSFAIQFAYVAGARVIATASAGNRDFLRTLGAAEAIAYDEEDFVEAVRAAHPDGVDRVVDVVGGDVLERSAELVRPGGRVASAVSPAPPAALAERGAGFRYVFVRPDGVQLEAIAALIDSGDVKVHLQEVLPLAQAARAHELIESAHKRGKIVLTVD